MAWIDITRDTEGERRDWDGGERIGESMGAVGI
jgi:hypothetical protein